MFKLSNKKCWNCLALLFTWLYNWSWTSGFVSVLFGNSVKNFDLTKCSIINVSNVVNTKNQRYLKWNRYEVGIIYASKCGMKTILIKIACVKKTVLSKNGRFFVFIFWKHFAHVVLLHKFATTYYIVCIISSYNWNYLVFLCGIVTAVDVTYSV